VNLHDTIEVNHVLFEWSLLGDTQPSVKVIAQLVGKANSRETRPNRKTQMNQTTIRIADPVNIDPTCLPVSAVVGGFTKLE
jgi:hypothetical protein